MRTPEKTFRAMLDGARRLQNGDRGQVDKLAEVYAEDTDVQHPAAQPRGAPAALRRGGRGRPSGVVPCRG